jgi:hypothetical protein
MSYNIIDVVKDIVTGKLEFASVSDAKQRYQICKQCEVRNKTLNVCTICGCFLPAKTVLKKSSCPMGQW